MNFKNLDENFSSDSVVENLLRFLELHIYNFWEKSKHKSDTLEKEDVLTEMLHHYLTQKARTKIFYFTPQSIQAEGKRGTFRKVDIGVSIFPSDDELVEVNYFFLIEAKYLPAKDYVTGNYAAIKRFKANEHGIKSKFNESPLFESGVVAYIKSGNYEEHLNSINQEVQELSSQFSTTQDEFGLNWQDTEKLIQERLNKHLSHHTRIDNSHLTLHHFWVMVNNH